MTITIFMLSFYWQIAWNSICLRENADKCMQAENRIVLAFVMMTEALTCMLSVCFFVLSYLVESVWVALVGVKFVARFLTFPESTK